MSVIQIGILGIIGAIFAIQFKNGKSEYGIYISIAISLIIFFSIVTKLSVIINTVKEISGHMNLNPSYIGTLIKMLGITYVAEFASGICKDAGYQTIAVQVEIFSKLAILVLSMPVLIALLQTIEEFLS